MKKRRALVKYIRNHKQATYCSRPTKNARSKPYIVCTNLILLLCIVITTNKQ